MNVHIRFENVTVNYGPKAALADVVARYPRKADSWPSSGRPTPARPPCCGASIAPSTSCRRPRCEAGCCRGSVHWRHRGRNGTVPLRPGRLQIRNVYELAPQGRHGLPAAGGAAAVDLRERGLCPASRRHARRQELGRDRREVPSPGDALGRSEGPPGHARHQAFRRPAAAAHPRPGPLAAAGNPLPRRVLDRH